MGTGIVGIVVLLLGGLVLFGVVRGLASLGSVFSGSSKHAELNCPQCGAIVSANETTCKECGFEYR